MDCGYFEKLIYRLPDGDLTESEQAQLDAHLDECDDCRALCDALALARADMAKLVAVPDGFAAKVMDGVHAEEKAMKAAEEKARRNAKIRQRWRFGDLGIAAACLALVVVTLNVLYGDLGRRTTADTAEAAPMMLEEAVEETVAAADTTAGTGTEYGVAEAAMEGAAADNGAAANSALTREAADEAAPETAEILVMNGSGALVGTLDTDTLAALLTDADGSTAGTDAPPTWTVEANGAIYELFVMDEVLFWRTQGEDTLIRSGLDAQTFADILG